MLLKEFQSDVYDEEELAKFFENFDHHSDYFRNNYFNVLRYMVTKSPVFRATTYGGWGVISKYVDMRSVATDPVTFPNDNQARVVPAQPLPNLIPPDVNPPEHTFYRQVLNPLFAPSVMAQRRDEVFRPDCLEWRHPEWRLPVGQQRVRLGRKGVVGCGHKVPPGA